MHGFTMGVLMANFTNSPNMSMPVPTVGVDSGPDWANNLNSCLNILDNHNHAPGYGVQIPPSGINLNSDLTFQSNNALAMRSVRFTSQSTPLSTSSTSDIGCSYVAGGDLYYNDTSGNQIRITQTGGLAGNPGSIANLTSPATASYVSGNATFVWQSAANTPATLDSRNLILRNAIANSKGLTLSPPNSMASDITMVFPTIPGSTSFMTMDTSGNMSASPSTVGGITGANIASATVTGTNIAATTITASNIAAATITRANLTSVGQSITASSGLYESTNINYGQITNFLVTPVTTHGRPVMIFFQGDSTGSASFLASNDSVGGFIKILRDSTVVSVFRVQPSGSGVINVSNVIPASTIMCMDTPTAGSYTYQAQAKVGNGDGTISVFFASMVVYELF